MKAKEVQRLHDVAKNATEVAHGLVAYLNSHLQAIEQDGIWIEPDASVMKYPDYRAAIDPLLAQTPGLLASSPDGPVWLTGGQFGMEASVLVPILSLGIAAALLVYAKNRRQVLAPFWKRNTDGTATDSSAQT